MNYDRLWEKKQAFALHICAISWGQLRGIFFLLFRRMQEPINGTDCGISHLPHSIGCGTQALSHSVSSCAQAVSNGIDGCLCSTANPIRHISDKAQWIKLVGHQIPRFLTVERNAYFPNGNLNGKPSATLPKSTLSNALPISCAPPATAAPRSAAPLPAASPSAAAPPAMAPPTC